LIDRCFPVYTPTLFHLTERENTMHVETMNALDLNALDLTVADAGDFADLQVVSLGDAMAMPETGASSGISSCNSCSCCGSTSCCSVNGISIG